MGGSEPCESAPTGSGGRRILPAEQLAELKEVLSKIMDESGQLPASPGILAGSPTPEASIFHTASEQFTEESELASNACNNFNMPSPSESRPCSLMLPCTEMQSEHLVFPLALSPRTSSAQPGSPRDSEFGLAEWHLGMEALLDTSMRHSQNSGTIS